MEIKIDLSGLSPSAAADLQEIIFDALTAIKAGHATNAARSIEDLLNLLEEELAEVGLPASFQDTLDDLVNNLDDDPALLIDMLESLAESVP